MGREQDRLKLGLALVAVCFGALSSSCLVCSGNSPADGTSSCDPGPGGGTGGTDGGGGSASLGGIANGGVGSAGVPISSCNNLELRSDAPLVTVTSSEETAPAPKGGEIADGTYFYTAHIIYESAGAAPTMFPRTQVTISGDTWLEASGNESNVSHSSRKLTTSSNTFTLTTTCPVGGNVESGTYTAADTSLTFYSEEGLRTAARVFTRQ
jgi:hypothetical protein